MALARLKKDFSISAVAAGFIVLLVGMSSSAIIVFQAASSFGVDAAHASSWLGSLCLAMGLLTVYLSAYHKVPYLIAWSTPGAALLVTSAQGFTLPQAIGAFVFSAFLVFLSGATKAFEKLNNRIPTNIVSALLSGVLVNFVLNAFTAFNTQPILIAVMFVVYLLGKKLYPHLTILFVLLVGLAIAALNKSLNFENVQLLPTQFTYLVPEFSISAMVSLGVPLFIVTMASQNVTGLSIMRSYNYQAPISKPIAQVGFANMITALFGGFALNLAAITAAIAMSPESNPNKDKRYIAGITSGILYIIVGLLAGTVTSFFAAFPKELIASIAGFALLGTVSQSLHSALTHEQDRESAFITFALAASGFKFLNIGSAFWALVIGYLVSVVMKKRG